MMKDASRNGQAEHPMASAASTEVSTSTPIGCSVIAPAVPTRIEASAAQSGLGDREVITPAAAQTR